VLGLERIVGRAREDNLASHRVLRKLGMEYRKEFHDPDDGTRWLQYEIARTDFRRAHPAPGAGRG
jgi:RimJ/RimL family protein N-acetyltransferase